MGTRGARPQDRGAGRAARRPGLVPVIDPWPPLVLGDGEPLPALGRPADEAHRHRPRPRSRSASAPPAPRRASAWSGSRPLPGPWPWPDAPGCCLRPRVGRSAGPGTRARARWRGQKDADLAVPQSCRGTPTEATSFPRNPGLVQDADPPLGHPRSRTRRPACGLGWHPPPSRPPAAVCALDRGDKAPQGLGHLLAGFPPGEPVGEARGEGRDVSPQRSRSSGMVIVHQPVEGVLILLER
jgi:hypothetical protein